MMTAAATIRTTGSIEAELGERSLRRLERDEAARQIRRDEQGALAADTASDTACWYVAAVHPGHEQETEAALTAIGAEALVPMRRGKRRKRRGRILPPQDEVLMTGYVLVRFVSTAKALRGLLRQEHVTAILGGWETPYAISADAISALMRKADNGAFDYERLSDVQVAAGEQVTVEEGIFAGQVGTVVTANMTGKGDVVIEVDLFGRMTPMVVPLAVISKV
ncbi:transcription termination/antitermination NusG family protein [Martelella sp. HB161492]|uniref:transcription termination/antitermination protein NusG n=1 Tax=Martelella sp. HB161492 TaxID=2720726 RepID=UPI00158FD110|nr:transcription termination/antitermination NusG family protein [Martelella sp. HB161492]